MVFRADHVGSLLRPTQLVAARRDHRAGRVDRDDLRRIENDCIAQAVRRQEQVGLAVVTDGDFRRENWWIDFVRKIPGVAIGRSDGNAAFAGHSHVPLHVAVNGRIGWDGSILADDAARLLAMTAATAKVTLPSPTRIHFHGGDAAVAQEAYADIAAFWDDVAAFYRREIAALETVGCRYIQIDDPMMSYFVDDFHRANMLARGLDPDSTLARYVSVINACVAARGPDTRLALHICRGNARSSWVATGVYARIADIVFPELDVDALLLEYDDDRSGDFAPLKLVPDRVSVVLGLLSSKHPTLEHVDTILHRIDQATRFVPLDRLALSPQCGFASTEEGNLLNEDDQWRKLALVVEIASRVWG
ncbi:MAG: 5-methyltetrahydropteroyltriglutamate--homocysteine S-methyltransferase [Alphaproteobacteria bacterium]